MSPDEIAQVVEVLDRTYKELPTTARGLRVSTLTRLREHERALRLYQRALDEYDSELVYLCPGSGLERGMTIMTNAGPRRIKAFSATGVGVSDNGFLAWEDRDHSTPFVVIDTWVD